MMFFLFFSALELFSGQLRDVWDEGVSKSINFNEKTVLKLLIRVASPKIAVRNFCIFFQNEPESICGPQLLYGNAFNLISSCKSDPSRPSIISHVNIFVYTQ
jgi:hypothetical protein